MKPQDIFKLAIRLLGLVFLYHGLQILPTAIVQLCYAVPNGNVISMLTSVIMAGWPLFIACWLIRGASLIVRIAYPDAPASVKSETQIG